MKQIKHLSIMVFISSIFLAFLPGLPAQANLKSCIENQLDRPDFERFKLDLANEVLKIEHDDLDYHWVVISSSSDGLKDVTAVIIQGSNGFCDMKAFDGTKDMTLADYEAELGLAVVQKFQKAFQAKQ
ncbi:hypothetical protein ACSYAD_32885 [Acaryochloris marina NIES-2412]|uniref:hypothetical protein n=1 Tax=Acaryochloris marina TaxID=155978 RepID=UPI004059028A